MSMRLGRRHALHPSEDLAWIRAVVPWSPAAIWPSFANDVTGGLGDLHRLYAAVSASLNWAGDDGRLIPESPRRRMEFFYGGFDWRPAGVLGEASDPSEHKAQADLWWRLTWPCHKAAKIAARLDRHETYDENFRRWHWRLGAEQLVFSQQETIPPGHYPTDTSVPLAKDKRPPLYLSNTTRMFLSCGEKDVGGALCDHTRSVAWRMVNTPGYFRYLKNTGHSIDNERPDWFAAEVAHFLQQ